MRADKARDIVLRRGWLSQTPKPFQQAILDRCNLQEFLADASIYMPGDPPGGIFGFVAGHISVFTAPRVRVPYILTPGTWLGVASAITGQPRRVGLRATRHTELLHLSLPAIHEIVSSDPATWRLFALLPLIHLDLAIGASDDLMIRDHVKRLIAIILRLGGCRLTTPPELRTNRNRRQPTRPRCDGQRYSDHGQQNSPKTRNVRSLGPILPMHSHSRAGRPKGYVG